MDTTPGTRTQTTGEHNACRHGEDFQYHVCSPRLPMYLLWAIVMDAPHQLCWLPINRTTYTKSRFHSFFRTWTVSQQVFSTPQFLTANSFVTKLSRVKTTSCPSVSLLVLSVSTAESCCFGFSIHGLVHRLGLLCLL